MILQTINLSHKYSSNWAIRDINIQIAHSGIVGLLGANGSGKSTTLNIICGTLNQTAGEVLIDGVNLRQHPEEAKKKVGFLPQQLPLYTDLTIDEYLLYSAQLRRIEKGKIKAAMEETKERCGIGHLSSRLIKNLSGGYRQRVGIAQAIIHKPKLVILDEPTNGLDPNQIIEVRKLILGIAREHSVLLSSHILTEVNLLCKEIVMIESGRVVFSDSMESFNNYAQSDSLVVRFENPPSREELLKIAGVDEVEMISHKQMRIRYSGDQAVSDRIVAASVSGNWLLREIGADTTRLDNIFKQLSSQTAQ
jgi:ABC-2 type transport system ATP-binding protein